jgi:simple sugar transport system ATP-binding protein
VPTGPAPASELPVVQMRGIRKTFGAIRALEGVDLAVGPGEVLGLVGDNSAGKSTLMKVLTGAYHPDAGEILVHGRPEAIVSPQDSRRLGIEMVYQDFALCGNLDVATNIFLGRWPTRGGFVRASRMEAEARRILGELGVDPGIVRQPVETLSGGRQQLVAIARAVSFAPRLVVLDEPTANLSVVATGHVLDLVRELKHRGVAQIVISHRLPDIFAVADRVLVLKRGRNVGERRIRETTEDEVLTLIVQGDAAESARRD